MVYTKRLVALVICAVAFALVAGCGSSKSTTTSSATSSGTVSSSTTKSKGTIAFLLSGPDIYYQYGLKGAEAAAAKLGYTIKAYPNPNISPSVELANVEDAVAAGVKAIDGYSVGLSTETATIGKASAAGIPIFLMYGYSPSYLHAKDVVGFEQVPLEAYTYPDGVYLKGHLKAGSTVAVITGQLGRGDAEGYRTGFLQGLGCTGNVTAGTPTLTCANGVKYVDTETGHWLRPDAYTAMADIISKYPSLGGVLVENEDMAVGAHTALVAAHKSPLMVSQNGAPYGIDGLKAGWLDATSATSPTVEGVLSVRLINAYLNKQITGGKLYYSPWKVITKTTIDPTLEWPYPESSSGITYWMSQPLPTAVASPPS
jgi:ABC-type sugar transport system substrate-binding protein